MRALLLVPALLTLGCEASKPQKIEKPKPSKKPEALPKAEKLLILATSDVGSDTDVCGCKVRRMGGIARRAQVMRDRAKAYPGRTLVLDAGDLFFRSWTLAPKYEPQARETADFHADVLAAFEAAAVAVGERDLALGLPALRRAEKRSGAKLLSANLVHAATGTAAFAAFEVVERSGLKIGIVGISPELKPEAQAHQVYQRAGLKVLPAKEALLSAAKSARKAGAQLIIGLLHIGERRAQEVLGALPEGTVELAVVGHDRLSGNLKIISGKTAVIHGGNRGKWLVAVEMLVQPGARAISDSGALKAHQKTIDLIEKRIATYQSQDAGVSEPTLAARLQEDRKKTIERLVRRKEKMLKELKGVSHAGQHTVQAEVIPLDAKLPQEPQILAAYKAYQDRLHIVNTGALPKARTELTYLGTKACKSCHLPAYKHWKKTKHAKAWATMVKTRQTANLDCIPCHTTGFDRPGGPVRVRGLEKFTDVGCESCHGPGSAHAKNVKIEMDYTQVPEKVCAECHRVQADQKPFVYEERLPKVVGKGHKRKSS